MPAINLHLNGDGCWPDIREKLETGDGIIDMMGNGHPPLELAALPGGMASGATSVTLRINLPDGRVLLTETSLLLLDSAVRAIKARHGDPQQARELTEGTETYDPETGYLLGIDTPTSIVRRQLKRFSDFYDDVIDVPGEPPLMFVAIEHRVEIRDDGMGFYRGEYRVLPPIDGAEHYQAILHYTAPDRGEDRQSFADIQGRPPVADRKPTEESRNVPHH